MSDLDAVTIGRAAASVGVTVRTLHHWEQLGLARPSTRSAAGYRLYTDTDLAQLRRVKVYRDLGVELGQIGMLLNAPAAVRNAELSRRRDELDDRIRELQGLRGTVDDLIEAAGRGMLMDDERQRAVLGQEWRPQDLADAAERWADSPQWAEYTERAASRSPEEWARLAAESTAVEQDLLAAMRDGAQPGSARTDGLADRHRESLSAYFHCTPSMHAVIGRMYATEPAYIAHFDDRHPGFAAWIGAVIAARVRVLGVDPDTATWE